MKLQTQIPLNKQTENQMDYQSKILLLGSCFVENIGNKLEYFKFQSVQNPFGILFHSKVIDKLIHNALHEKKYSEEDIFFHNEQWHCFDAHSQLSNISKDELLVDLNHQLNLTAKQLHEATHLIITLGTAWIYRHSKSNLPVANCHKVPQKEFEKELLSVEDIAVSLQNIMNGIHRANPSAKIIFTVSPVRHIKDGFIENTQSKAHVIAAIHQILSHQSFYFPSYELMMDELRDYRFYAEDMLHPNQTAINYIWEKFQEVWIDSDAKLTMNEVDVVQKGLRHQVFNSNSTAHQQFLQQLELKKEQLQKRFPWMIFSK